MRPDGSLRWIAARIFPVTDDAGVVYRTDAINAGDKVATVEFAEAADAVNTYPIAVLKDTRRRGPAQQFVETVTGAAGRQILDAAGFGKP